MGDILSAYNEITPLQERDSCLALVFLLLLIWLFCHSRYLVYSAMAVLLYGMIWPAGMRPFAWFWFRLSHALGRVVGSCLLALIWCLLVVPVGFIRRLMGKDSMRLKKWHQNKDSAFVTRDHKYTAADINAPY